jgi:molecular chaperone DnaK
MKLRRDVQASSDEPIESVVLSVPAHFSDPQRRATWQAGKLAGLNVVDLVEEPLAAAAHYSAHRAKPGSTILVYHLGGETFDATVLHARDDGLYALATEGVSDLGGKNFDKAVMDLIAEQFRLAHHFDPLQHPAAYRQLRRQAEAIKIKLSAPGKKEVRTALLLGGRVQEIVLTRCQFDHLTAALVERSLSVCEATLRAAGRSWADIDQVILAGGSSLLPNVLEGIRRISGKSEDAVRCHQPHLAIAYGAALLSSQQAGLPGPASPLCQRITGMDLGFRVLDPRTRETTMDVVISKNTPMPIWQTRVYYSNRPDQARLVFDVIQARNRGEPIFSLGHFAFPLERPRKNHPLEVTLGYDRGLVTIVARDPDTGRAVRQEYGTAVDRDEGRALEQARLLHNVKLCEF